MQSVAAVLASVDCRCTPHSKHAALPFASLKVPAGHAVATVPFAPVWPKSATQFVTATLPAGDTAFAGQSEHGAPPSSAFHVSAGHAVHCEPDKLVQPLAQTISTRTRGSVVNRGAAVPDIDIVTSTSATTDVVVKKNVKTFTLGLNTRGVAGTTPTLVDDDETVTVSSWPCGMWSLRRTAYG